MVGVGLELCAGDEGDWIVSYIEEGYGADASKAILRGDKVCLPVSLTSSHATVVMRKETWQREHPFYHVLLLGMNPSSWQFLRLDIFLASSCC